MKGKAHLVGAGPGNPGLLTLRGEALLKKADVTLYDRLVNPRLLEICRPECERIFVGKEKGKHAMQQDAINRLMIDRARAGKTVVRLKGGDPFVFGRGGEEAEALAKAGVPFEIVPGVSSAVAAPAFAGIPVTHRDLATSFAVISGAEAKTKESAPLDWGKLATGVDTLVFMMGVGNLKNIQKKLLENGRPPDTPAAMIEWGGVSRQKSAVATLETLTETVEKEGLKHPAVVIIGKTASLASTLNWFESRPLFGKKILVPRSRRQAAELIEKLEDLGADALPFPVIEQAPPEDFSGLDEAVRGAGAYDLIVFTSANGVEAFFERLTVLKLDIRSLAGPRIFAVGPTTAEALSSRGLIVEDLPEKFVAESLFERLNQDDLKGKKILLPRADIARTTLDGLLKEAGAIPHAVVAYRTVLAEGADPEILQSIRNGTVDAIAFTSASTVDNFLEKIKPIPRESLAGTLFFFIGPIAAARAEALGLPIAGTAREHTLDGLVETIASTLQAKREGETEP